MTVGAVITIYWFLSEVLARYLLHFCTPLGLGLELAMVSVNHISNRNPTPTGAGYKSAIQYIEIANSTEVPLGSLNHVS